MHIHYKRAGALCYYLHKNKLWCQYMTQWIFIKSWSYCNNVTCNTQKLTGHFHLELCFSHIRLQKASPSKQWMCLQFCPRTGVTIREWVSGQNSEMSIDSSFASEWDSKLWCSRSFVCIAGIRLVVLRCSIILLKLNNNKRNEITVNSPVSRHPWDQAYNVAVCL